MSLSGSAKLLVNFVNSTTADFETASSTISLPVVSLSYTNGNGAGNADRIWKDTRTLTASSSETLDFSGSLTDIYGSSVVFADIRLVVVTADSANTNNVNVTRATTSPETGLPLFLASGDGIAVRPGGVFMWGCTDATGVVVTATTADKLTFTNSAGGTSVSYSVVVVGSSV